MQTTVTKFKTTIDLYPKNSSDLNLLFSVSYAEYKGYVALLKTLMLGQAFLKPLLEDAMTKLDNEVYSAITKGVGVLNDALKSILPPPFNKDMDIGVGAMGDLLAASCTDYLGSIPEDLFNVFQDIKNKVNTALSRKMPPGLMKSVVDDLMKAKDDAMKELLGNDIFDTVISPLVAYENFLKENGINDIIKRMEKLEKCMTKPGIGGRKKSDFIEPKSKKLYSAYYKSLFMINTKGKLNVKSMGVSPKNISQMNNVMKSVDSFRTIKFI